MMKNVNRDGKRESKKVNNFNVPPLQELQLEFLCAALLVPYCPAGQAVHVGA